MMFAQVSGLKPGEFIHVIADAHIYDRHVPAVEEIIKNAPKPAPKFIDVYKRQTLIIDGGDILQGSPLTYYLYSQRRDGDCVPARLLNLARSLVLWIWQTHCWTPAKKAAMLC